MGKSFEIVEFQTFEEILSPYYLLSFKRLHDANEDRLASVERLINFDFSITIIEEKAPTQILAIKPQRVNIQLICITFFKLRLF